MNSRPNLADLSATIRGLELLNSYYVSQCMFAAVKLGIPDLLGDCSSKSSELAQLSGSNEAYLKRMLRMLVRVGVFDEPSKDYFTNSPISNQFRKAAVFSLESLTLLHSEYYWDLWQNLDDTIRGGESAVRLKYNSSPFAMIGRSIERLTRYHDAIAHLTSMDCLFVEDLISLREFRTFIDVGGGGGQLGFSISQTYPHLTGYVLDLPALEPSFGKLKSKFAECNVSFLPGDFFVEIPGQVADVLILKNVLHDWGNIKAHQILNNCRKVMNRAEQRLLIIEIILGTIEEPLYGRMRDLNMMVTMDGGMERTSDQFGVLLEESDLRIVESRILPSGQSVMVCEAT